MLLDAYFGDSILNECTLGLQDLKLQSPLRTEPVLERISQNVQSSQSDSSQHGFSLFVPMKARKRIRIDPAVSLADE